MCFLSDLYNIKEMETRRKYNQQVEPWILSTNVLYSWNFFSLLFHFKVCLYFDFSFFFCVKFYLFSSHFSMKKNISRKTFNAIFFTKWQQKYFFPIFLSFRNLMEGKKMRKFVYEDCVCFLKWMINNLVLKMSGRILNLNEE